MILAALLAVPAPIVIRVVEASDRCRFMIGERSFDLLGDDPVRDATLAALPAEAPVRIIPPAGSAYRCVGGLAYTLQRYGRTLVEVGSATPEP